MALAELIGKRLTIRLRQSDGGYRDIVGHLETPTSLRNRSGELIEFDQNKIKVWREIIALPDRAGKGAPASVRIRELEDIFNLSWQATEQVALGKWLMRASGKYTMRANSVLPQGMGPFGDPGLPIAQGLAKVVEFYLARKQEPIIQISLPIYKIFDEELAALGWIEKVKALVMVADIAKKEFEIANGYSIEVLDTCSDEWLSVQNDFPVREIMLRTPALYGAIRFEENLIAVVRTAVVEKWCVVSRLFVNEVHRGKNLAQSLMTSLLNQCLELGATKAGLQVESENIIAQQIYENLGFTVHHHYSYRGLGASTTSDGCENC